MAWKIIMSWFEGWTDWFGEAVTGAVSGTAVYFYGVWRTAGEKRRIHRASVIARLGELREMLRISRKLFRIQKRKMRLLRDTLKEHHAERCKNCVGYDATFSRCFSVMDEQEKDLHGIIRAYTYSIQRINQSTQKWLEQDTLFKTDSIQFLGSELGQKLRALEVHLILWQAKFEYWIPNRPDHAVVYMADEKKHGIGFPPGTDAAVISALNKLKEIWFKIIDAEGMAQGSQQTSLTKEPSHAEAKD